jgi:copper chaperone CopZ|tara:strand:- start:74 stop:1795 length:1722 start_codon:yes stop_codon:yes gene_type:complete
MYKLILILLFAYCFAVDTENEIRTGQHTLKNLYVNRGELELESDINIHGIQFDIIYNPREIKSITPLQIRGYEVLFNAISDSLIRSLIYSLEGKNLPEIINYDFVKADGFNGVSTVQFVDISAADSNGQSIEFPKVKSYDIDFRGYTLLERKSLNNIELSRDDIYDDSWAVIIGIDKYKYSDQLNYAVKDAEAVKDMLISKFDYPEENIRYLTNEDATLSNIKLNLGEVATSAGREDRILIFYSGHGETSVGADKSETGYIVPYEGKIDNLYATGLAMDDILRTCQLSKSKHMLFLMDACYSGLMTENVKSLSTPSEEGYLNKVANEKARQIITAGGRDEQVIERDEWQHSAFTKNLLAGLDDWESDTDEDGYVTADELGTYLRISVTEDSDNLQTPQKGRFKNSGGGEFVFFSDATITIPSSNIDEEDEIIYGCMDEEANNYNPNATRRDRSCQYGEELTSIKQLVEQYRKSPVASRESNNFQIDEINIPTAQCGMCEKNIENALNGIDGIFKYKVELETYRVQVEYNTDKLSLKIIEKLISKAGYQANNYPADVDAYNKLAKCCKLPKDRR